MINQAKEIIIRDYLCTLCILITIFLLCIDLHELQNLGLTAEPYSIFPKLVMQEYGVVDPWSQVILIRTILHGILFSFMLMRFFTSKKICNNLNDKDLGHCKDSYRNYFGVESYQSQKKNLFKDVDSYDQLNGIYYDDELKQKELIINKVKEIDIHGNLDLLLTKMHELLDESIEYDKLFMALLDNNGMYNVETLYADASDLRMEPLYKSRFDGDLLNRLLHGKDYLILNDLQSFSETHSISPLSIEVVKQGFNACTILPIRFRNHCVGYTILLKKSGCFNGSEGDFGFCVLDEIKHKLYMEYLLQYMVAHTSQAFVEISHEKDDETSRHIQRVTQYSHIIACRYYEKYKDVSPRLIREISWYASLHDIGKIGIPDEILNKPGPLTDEERSYMQRHVAIGETVIRHIGEDLSKYMSNSIMKTAIDIIGSHHERFDGSGYPRGLEGEKIPLAGRIVAVADVFDALTSKRSYKRAYPFKAALLIMKEDMMGHFDPKIFQCFEDSKRDIDFVYRSLREI